MKGIKLAVDLEEFHAFVLSLRVRALSKLCLSCAASARFKGSFLVQISFSKTRLTERLCKHELAAIRVLLEIFNVLCQHEAFFSCLL